MTTQSMMHSGHDFDKIVDYQYSRIQVRKRENLVLSYFTKREMPIYSVIKNGKIEISKSYKTIWIMWPT